MKQLILTTEEEESVRLHILQTECDITDLENNLSEMREKLLRRQNEKKLVCSIFVYDVHLCKKRHMYVVVTVTIR